MKIKLFILVVFTITFSQLTFSQDGCKWGDCVNGYGGYKYANGDYAGDFVNGYMNGKGFYLFNNAQSYQGDFVDSKFQGYGIFKWAGGDKLDRYEGNWFNNVKQGYGILYYSNGEKYEGEFVNGVKQGQGKLTYISGKIKEGEWVNDKFISTNSISQKGNNSGNDSQTNTYKTKNVVSSTKSSQNKSVASVQKNKPKKIPTTRECECCGIVFKIVNGWGYQNSLGNVKVFQFGEPDELALDILTTNIGTSMGYSEDQIGYHSYIKYHSKRCAYDCGN
jgi:hypothetical protein